MADFKQLVHSYRYHLCFLALGLIYVLNGFIDIMDYDAGQYASIAMEMSQSNSFLEVYYRGNDYLDKPPLLFWLSALSFKLFGLGSFSYKLPAVLILILGLYSTYRFALLWYDKKRAILATVILASTTSYFLMTNDVRTDGLLTGFVIFSLWQLSAFNRNSRLGHLFLGAVGAACALMTKGPIGLAIIAFGVGGDLLLKRQWRKIFRWEWVAFIGVVAVLLLPMCYGLYTQFDLHPEKTVYGLEGPSGLRFFFWTQSFGRITGELYWENDAGFFFFFTSMLWDFQPWVLFFIPALVFALIGLVTSRFRIDNNREGYMISAFVLSFLALSTSNYKLPHYIFPLFPLAAVITADHMVGWVEDGKAWFRTLGGVQFGLMHIFCLAPFISFALFFPPNNWLLVAVCAGLFLLFWYVWLKGGAALDKVVFTTVIASVSLGLVMAVYFYPQLLQYQGGSSFARDVQKMERTEDLHYYHAQYENPPPSLEFYSGKTLPDVTMETLDELPAGALLYMHPTEYAEVRDARRSEYKVLKEYNDFYVTLLSLDFLLKSSRDGELRTVYLVEKQ